MSLSLNLGSVFIKYPDLLCGGGVAPSFCDTISNCVTINGVTWATANVACPGYFVSSKTAYGLFYQWDNKVGWSSTDPMTNSNGGTTWNNTTASTNTSWLSTNDPSPAGFHVPTVEESISLIDTTHVTSSFVTNYNGTGVNGCLFTEISTGNTLFLPACGYREDSSGALNYVGSYGYYWLGTLHYNNTFFLGFFNDYSDGYPSYSRIKGYSVRPVLSDRVTINGVTWSTRNVNTPGTFTTSPLDAGMFYQWDINVGWSSSDPLTNSNGGTTWNTTASTNTSWLSTNDPSPAGFHVPTQAELNTLLDTTYVTSSWITCNNVSGMLFTEISTGNTLFFPACGSRIFSSGELSNVGSSGGYWSATQYSGSLFYQLGISSGNANMRFYNRNGGLSVRPVLT